MCVPSSRLGLRLSTKCKSQETTTALPLAATVLIAENGPRTRDRAAAGPAPLPAPARLVSLRA